RRLVAARPGPDLDDAVAVVQRIAWDQEREKRGLELADRLLETLLLGTGLGRHFGVVNGNELTHLRELVVRPMRPRRHFDHRLKSPVFPAKLGEAVRIANRGRIAQRLLDLAGPGESGLQPIAKGQIRLRSTSLRTSGGTAPRARRCPAAVAF